MPHGSPTVQSGTGNSSGLGTAGANLPMPHAIGDGVASAGQYSTPAESLLMHNQRGRNSIACTGGLARSKSTYTPLPHLPPGGACASAEQPTAHGRRSFLNRQRSSIMSGHHGSTSTAKSAVYTIDLDGDDGGIEMKAAQPYLFQAYSARDKYKCIDKGQVEGVERLVPPVALHSEEGIFWFSDQHTQMVSWEEYFDDITALQMCMQQPNCQSSCHYRLQVLEEKYNTYKLCNSEIEENTDRYRRTGGVLGGCTKVDNHVHLEHMMLAEELVDQIQRTVEERGEDVVAMSDAAELMTLRRVCELLDFVEPNIFTVDSLGLQPFSEKPLACFDPLDPKLNRGGRTSAELLRYFLSRDTINDGMYLAEAVRPRLARNDARQRHLQATETLVEITGLIPDEWEKMAGWIRGQGLDNYHMNRWIIALPRRKMRVDSMQSESGSAKLNFENHHQHLESLFLPLLTATLASEDPKNAELAAFLSHVGSFVIVSDDEAPADTFQRNARRPAELPWTAPAGEFYFAYYVWANLCSLNALRRRRGMNTFQLRCATGSSGDSHVSTLMLSYLLCDSVSNGLPLSDEPVLQYLFGMRGIGVSMSPIRCNSLDTNYMEHPLKSLFRRGLRVSLCTVSPLMYHHGTDPLAEEYSTACKLYRLSGVDMSEIALNSVMMSSFDDEVKAKWLGDAFVRDGLKGNHFELSHVPTARLELRQEMWNAERKAVMRNKRPGLAGGSLPVKAATFTGPDEAAVALPVSRRATVSENTTVGGGQEATAAGGVLNDASRQPAVGVGLPTGEIEPSQMGDKSKTWAPYVVVDPHIHFPRAVLSGPFEREAQHANVAQMLHRALDLRKQYVRPRRTDDWGMAGSDRPLHTRQIERAFRKDDNDAFDEDEWMSKTVEGIVVPHEVHQIPRLPKDMYHYDDFRTHVQELRALAENVHVRNFSTRRLELLENRFNLHVAVNHGLEAGSTAEKVSHSHDFYQSTKVDNNVRMETGMTARQLLNFIVSKARNNGDDIVSHPKGKEPQTLRQLLQELHISADSLTVDDLNVQAYTPLGVASGQYIPEGRDELLSLLLKTDNEMKGRYFAELTKLTFEDFKRDRFTFTENRLPLYGASDREWALLSDWFDTHGMASFHNQWVIQIPRIYGYLRKQGRVHNFAEYLENIFKPLWSVSLHPRKEPRLFHFVNHICAFDCVEDERRPDMPLSAATKPPHEWTSEDDPPFNYYMYHIWANLFSLNSFRQRRQFSTFAFRPSCGETGPTEHLIGGFLLSSAINYGVRLKDDATLQYLFYLAQIGVTVSPLSNNTKVLSYLDNPFPQFFRRGLMVSLGTDSPLIFHHTQEPLLEEYSIASKIWKLSPNDMCEIARNSVLVSGFDFPFKQERLGELYFLSSSISNDATRTHLSSVRVAFRYETYHTEVGFLEYVSGLTFQKAMLTLNEEEEHVAEYREGTKHKKEPAMQGIIDSVPEEADLDKLEGQRVLMQQQLDNLNSTLSTLQHQNKQLTEKLAEERTKDQQASQLRRSTAARELDTLNVHQMCESAGENRSGLTVDFLSMGTGGSQLQFHTTQDMEGERGWQTSLQHSMSFFPQVSTAELNSVSQKGQGMAFVVGGAVPPNATDLSTHNSTALPATRLAAAAEQQGRLAALLNCTESLWSPSETSLLRSSRQPAETDANVPSQPWNDKGPFTIFPPLM